MDGGLIATLVLQGISALYKRYKEIKISKNERASLEELVDTINRCISVTRKAGASSSSTQGRSDPANLVGTLEEVQKKLDEWSSEGSRFFWIFTNRIEELKALKQKVKSALKVHNLQILEQINERGKSDHERGKRNEEELKALRKLLAPPLQISKQSPAVKDNKRTPTREPRPSKRGTQNQRRSASLEPRKVPCENRKVEPKDSHHQSPQGLKDHQSSHVSIHPQQKPKILGVSKVYPTNSQGGPKASHHQGAHGSTHHQQNLETHIWVEISAPLDSEKQAQVVEDKLKICRDVTVVRVICDQPAKKVMVMVKAKAVEVKDTNSKIVQTLLHEIRNALPREKVLPTLSKISQGE